MEEQSQNKNIDVQSSFNWYSYDRSIGSEKTKRTETNSERFKRSLER